MPLTCTAADVKFLSTPSGWRATASRSINRIRTRYFYPRPPGGGRPARHRNPPRAVLISIHALRVEGDDADQHDFRDVSRISIHALRVEGDDERSVHPWFSGEFLSTPSGWRATIQRAVFIRGHARFLSTPSGWRATQRAVFIRGHARISIHALRVEGDVDCCLKLSLTLDFYPRPPGGGRPRLLPIC